MARDLDIVNLVENLVVGEFSRDAVIGVRARRNLDRDGDSLIWLDILLRDGVMPLDPRVTLPLNLAIRRAIEDVRETADPVVSYFPVSEYRQAYPEAA